MTLHPLSAREAETLAAEMLAWMAADQDLMGRFMGLTGAGLDDLHNRAGEPEFLGSVLDFLLSDEPALLACCEAIGVAPDRPMRARAGLPGGDLPHWT
ncbi:MAG: DUF3572 domain-containing protein [Pseudomonadota bacterium]